MGVSVTYTSSHSVSPVVRGKILAEGEVLNRSRDWWCESFFFLEDRDRSGILVGDTKIALIGYSLPVGRYREVDPDEEELAGWADVNFILTQLCRWSSEFEIDWDIDVAGEPCGRIEAGKPDDKLLEFLRSFRDSSPLPVTDLPRIRQKYADRNDPDTAPPTTTEPPPLHEQRISTSKRWWQFWR